MRSLDRHYIVEIGGRSEPSASVEGTPDTASAVPQRKWRQGGWAAVIPAFSAGISRRAPRAGRIGLAWGRFASPGETTERPPLLHETSGGSGRLSSRLIC